MKSKTLYEIAFLNIIYFQNFKIYRHLLTQTYVLENGKSREKNKCQTSSRTKLSFEKTTLIN